MHSTTVSVDSTTESVSGVTVTDTEATPAPKVTDVPADAGGYALTNDLLLRAVAQFPVIKDLNGVQGEHPVVYLNLAYDFAM